MIYKYFLKLCMMCFTFLIVSSDLHICLPRILEFNLLHLDVNIRFDLFELIFIYNIDKVELYSFAYKSIQFSQHQRTIFSTKQYHWWKKIVFPIKNSCEFIRTILERKNKFGKEEQIFLISKLNIKLP